jgi:hypothetical protein
MSGVRVKSSYPFEACLAGWPYDCYQAK